MAVNKYLVGTAFEDIRANIEKARAELKQLEESLLVDVHPEQLSACANRARLFITFASSSCALCVQAEKGRQEKIARIRRNAKEAGLSCG